MGCVILKFSMKTFIVIAVSLCAVTSASILPIRFTGTGSSNPSLTSVVQCPGHEDDILVVLPDSSSPDEVCMPGTMPMTVHTNVREDLPTDLVIELDLKKLEPFPMTVPCLSGVGSCPYEICPIIESMADIFCPAFPEGQPCGCPILAQEMVMEGFNVLARVFFNVRVLCFILFLFFLKGMNKRVFFS